MENDLLPRLRRDIIRNINQIRRHPVLLQPPNHDIMNLLTRRLCRLRCRKFRESLVVRERLHSGLRRVNDEVHSGLTMRRRSGAGGLTTVAPDGSGGVYGDFEGGAAGGGEVGGVDKGAVVRCEVRISSAGVQKEGTPTSRSQSQKDCRKRPRAWNKEPRRTTR